MFDGKLEPEVCTEWLEALEKNFEYEEIPTSQKVKKKQLKLKGPTLSWLSFLQNGRVEEEQ